MITVRNQATREVRNSLNYTAPLITVLFLFLTVIEHSEPVKLVKDNPYWPYSSEEDKKKDESAGLTPPIIKETTGSHIHV